MDKGRGVLNFDNVSRLPEHWRPKYICMPYLFIFSHLGVYDDEPNSKASELYELFRKLSFQILSATSSNLKFFLVSLSSTKTGVVLSTNETVKMFLHTIARLLFIFLTTLLRHWPV